jgi:hypothetical protein
MLTWRRVLGGCPTPGLVGAPHLTGALHLTHLTHPHPHQPASHSSPNHPNHPFLLTGQWLSYADLPLVLAARLYHHPIL